MSNWMDNFQELCFLLNEIEGINRVLESDDSITIQTVNEITDFPLVIASFSGTGSVDNSYNRFIEGEGFVDIVIAVKIDETTDPNEAKLAVGSFVSLVLNSVRIIDYILDSTRIVYGDALIAGITCMSASFTIKK